VETREEDQAVAVVESLGGKVMRGPKGEVTAVNLHGTEARGHYLKFLRAFSSLQTLNLFSTPVADPDLAILGDLPGSARWTWPRPG
jgi:hypothetical protein